MRCGNYDYLKWWAEDEVWHNDDIMRMVIYTAWEGEYNEGTRIGIVVRYINFENTIISERFVKE